MQFCQELIIWNEMSRGQFDLLLISPLIIKILHKTASISLAPNLQFNKDVTWMKVFLCVYAYMLCVHMRRYVHLYYIMYILDRFALASIFHMMITMFHRSFIDVCSCMYVYGCQYKYTLCTYIGDVYVCVRIVLIW